MAKTVIAGLLTRNGKDEKMEIQGVGRFERDEAIGWYYSQEMPLKVLDGKAGRIVLEGYDDDSDKESFHKSIRNFLSIDQSVLHAVENEVYRYYKDCFDAFGKEEPDFPVIAKPHDVWVHVKLGCEPIFSRRNDDKRVYASLECSCDWEIEHGLQIVFQDGMKVNKVGPYDGHLTNSDAYADDSLENVIYRSLLAGRRLQ